MTRFLDLCVAKLAWLPEIRDFRATLQFVTETLPLRSETDFAVVILFARWISQLSLARGIG